MGSRSLPPLPRYLSWMGVEVPSTASEVPFSRMGVVVPPPLPRYLFLGWGSRYLHRFRGTFFLDGGRGTSTASEVPFFRMGSRYLHRFRGTFFPDGGRATSTASEVPFF